MSAYRVSSHGHWWAVWQMPHHNPPGTRDATEEEAALMDKVVWETATRKEVSRLRELVLGDVSDIHSYEPGERP